MKTAALLREQIEDSLSARIPVALSPRARTQPEKTACGIAAIDQMLHGGLSAGALTEFVGQESSGRTSVVLACMAAITQAGNVGAWIDVADALSPESVAANGIDLERLLWVRCGLSEPAASHAPRRPAQGLLTSPGTPGSGLPSSGGGSPHPRSEGRNMPEAIQAILFAHGGLYDRQVRREAAKIGTPGAPNRPIPHRSQQREEQVNSDRLPPRRGDNLNLAPRCAEPQPRRIASISSGTRLVAEQAMEHALLRTGISTSVISWQALDQALRATDLLLQGGGFRIIVLDLGSVPPEMAWRIPLATWFRFRAACERSRVSLVLLTQHPCARSSAEHVVRLEPGTMEALGNVMTGIRYQAATERSRSYEGDARVLSMRKPPQSEHPSQWTSEAAWTQAR